MGEDSASASAPKKQYNFKKKKCQYGQKEKKRRRTQQSVSTADVNPALDEEDEGMAPLIRLGDGVPEVLAGVSPNQMIPPVAKPVTKKRADGNWRADQGVQARERQLAKERKEREAERKASQKKLAAEKKKTKAAEEKAKKAMDKTTAMGEKLEKEKKLRVAAEKKV